MSGENYQGFRSEPIVDDWVMKEVAEEFGELTLGSLARLHLGEEVSEHRAIARRSKLEKVAGEQVWRLCQAMDWLYDDREGLHAVLAASYGVGIGFALLPNRETAGAQGFNEETVLAGIEDNPAAWLEFDEPNSRFSYTEHGRQILRSAYLPGSGCPVVGLDVTNDGGQTTSNLFVLYWSMATRYWR